MDSLSGDGRKLSRHPSGVINRSRNESGNTSDEDMDFLDVFAIPEQDRARFVKLISYSL